LARGALGNPFLFAQTRAAFRGEAPPGPVPAAQRLAMALAQLRLSIRHKGEATACREMRKHFAHYTRGVPGAAELRRAIVTAATLGEYEAIVKEFLNRSDALR
jgi:tRNA-dihydrouridine synthase B